ncbi:Peptide deformylase [Fundidesulfovibrio magnetotacticus]|uniref:Peptide deformylase n=1 Tax=Fundidesulfovibrio magnetotacticus TaxID=2730080 RepID=A0A6V8LYN7_9BACT|nr:peptide deformylase [Fundidesulfovibrio magnetotacticus]GFK95348.1 Peptide deformylase [Fundidesulfovibrio magnetotacticus]
MPREILKYPHPVLAQRAKEITEITPELRKLAEEMAEAMYAKRGIGLAAPQVGECCRLIAVDVSGPDERTDLKFFVNPVIVSKEGQVTDEEGCLSVVNFRAKVTRAEKVKVKAKDLDGNEVEVDADGILAVCLQHEIDHLDGVLFIDHISRLKRALYDGKIKKWQKSGKQA